MRALLRTTRFMNRDQMEKTFGGPVVFGRATKSARSTWFWPASAPHLHCSSCLRSFPNGIYRQLGGFNKCPYADCDAAWPSETQDWSTVRLEHPNCPAVPWMAVQYPYKKPTFAAARSA